jgi:membrane dipeptidase
MDGRPFIASHSNCRKLCDHPRNLTDDQLRAVRDADGCVGLNVWNSFIDEDPEKRTVERLADHAEHMIDIMGIDHVGCGFDFCEFIVDPADPEAYTGDDKKTRGLEDASKVQNFFDVLRSRGMSREDMAKIAYGNFHRIIKEVIG